MALNPKIYSPWQFFKRLHLWQQIFIAMAFGISTGLIFGPEIVVVKPLGDLFIKLIKMLVVPLVFFTLIAGMTGSASPGTMGRIGLKAFGIYLATTVFAISMGLLIAGLIQPGAGVVIDVMDAPSPAKEPSLSETLLTIIPSNPIQALAEGNILQIIFIAVMAGVALSLMKPAASKPVVTLVQGLAEMMISLTGIVMKFAPIGVFALMAWVAGTQGMETLLQLGKLAVTMLVGVCLHILLIYGGAIRLWLRLSPWRFLAHIRNALAVAFSTSSSSATLPVTMNVAEERLGISRETASFVLPLGATINMDGTALYQGVVVMFAAQAMGVDLSTMQLITAVLTTTLASIGTAGIPGAGLVMLTMVLTAVGLPVEVIALVASIDRVLDMCRTAVNVAGDSFVALAVDHTEGRLDRRKFKLHHTPPLVPEIKSE